MLAPAWAMRWRSPELALAVASHLTRRSAEFDAETDRVRALVMLIGASCKVGRGFGVTAQAVRALRWAQALGATELEQLVRIDLAGCARALDMADSATALLHSVLDADTTPAIRASAMVEASLCLARSGRHTELDYALGEADRLYAEDDELDADSVLLRRAMVRAAAATQHRRRGDARTAEEASREGEHLLAGLADPGADDGSARARLVMERTLAKLDAGALEEAVRGSADLLSTPVRAPAAASVNWLRFALASRVHLPARRLGRARELLQEACASAERHQLPLVLVGSHNALAEVEELQGEHADALQQVRAAQAARSELQRGAAQARRVLTADFPPDEQNSAALIALLSRSAAKSKARKAKPAARQTAPAAETGTRYSNGSAPSHSVADRPAGDPVRDSIDTPAAVSGGGRRRKPEPETTQPRSVRAESAQRESAQRESADRESAWRGSARREPERDSAERESAQRESARQEPVGFTSAGLESAGRESAESERAAGAARHGNARGEGAKWTGLAGLPVTEGSGGRRRAPEQVTGGGRRRAPEPEDTSASARAEDRLEDDALADLDAGPPANTSIAAGMGQEPVDEPLAEADKPAERDLSALNELSARLPDAGGPPDEPEDFEPGERYASFDDWELAAAPEPENEQPLPEQATPAERPKAGYEQTKSEVARWLEALSTGGTDAAFPEEPDAEPSAGFRSAEPEPPVSPEPAPEPAYRSFGGWPEAGADEPSWAAAEDHVELDLRDGQRDTYSERELDAPIPLHRPSRSRRDRDSGDRDSGTRESSGRDSGSRDPGNQDPSNQDSGDEEPEKSADDLALGDLLTEAMMAYHNGTRPQDENYAARYQDDRGERGTDDGFDWPDAWPDQPAEWPGRDASAERERFDRDPAHSGAGYSGGDYASAGDASSENASPENFSPDTSVSDYAGLDYPSSSYESRYSDSNYPASDFPSEDDRYSDDRYSYERYFDDRYTPGSYSDEPAGSGGAHAGGRRPDTEWRFTDRGHRSDRGN